ncbi:MAG: hypothetical protein ACO3F2_06855 [Roseiflexaceae bacterium]
MSLLAQAVDVNVSVDDVYDCLGIGAVYVMSEEWWDPSVIELHPRMHVGFIPELHKFRQQQLIRLRPLGIDMWSTWYRAGDSTILRTVSHALTAGQCVGILGMIGVMLVSVTTVEGTLIIGRTATGDIAMIDINQMRAPAGIECVFATTYTPSLRNHVDELRWIALLLRGLPTIAFDTPRHPLRDWQVWHIGADALAVAAFSAQTAAPLAIVSDNVARIVHAYMWRIDVLQQQLVRINTLFRSSAVRNAVDACDDARFFMQFVMQRYPLTVERRALTLPEGALIAETCHDTRQVLWSIADMLNTVE